MIITAQDGISRILRPCEYKALRNATPMLISKLRMDALLYTGARFIELKELKGKPDLFSRDDKVVQLTTRKIKVKTKKRYCRLNDNGVKALETLLSIKKKNLMPTRETWNEMIKKWAIIAGIDPTGITSKTMRKTWESWLVTKYHQHTVQIFSSQGHTSITAINHYLSLPFTEEDKKEMEEFTRNWV